MRAEFKDRLQEAMKIRGISAATLAKRTGMNRSSVSRYLSGEYDPSRSSIFLMADALNVDPGWLMGGDIDTDYALHLSDDEVLLIETYRKADDMEQRLVKCALGMNKKR